MDMNSWVQLSVYLLVVPDIRYVEAKPIATGESRLSEDTGSLVYHILESSKLYKKDKDISPDDYFKEHARSGTEKGAIVGGTVAAGITLFIYSLIIYRQCIIRRRQRNGEVDTRVSMCRKAPGPGTTPDKSTHDSWRDTFYHQLSILDSESACSQRSFGNTPAATQIEFSLARPVPLPTMPAKAAQMLGIENTGSTTPLARTPLPSPRLPITSLSQNFMSRPLPIQNSSLPSPLQEHPPVPQPLSQYPPPQGPLPPIPISELSTVGKTRSSSRPQESTLSSCTMSTLGMELLHDVMQPLPPTKFSPPSGKASFPRSLPPVPRTKEPPPVAMDNVKDQKRTPSRRYFVPLFKNNGQLPTPTSPNEGLPSEVGIREEAEIIAKAKSETVLRDSSRAGLFSLGENKI
ncbi:hypothetical protein F53441_13621 [Fusarium austroafricanum]|uniref:Uncharacterized protein n=1 Tax=Fusarium austroafricanum TaxID=2364996 RepID=A0A8H4JQ23_9HYPO|nr:hypothetical protein F53441_13621 [Fusarium austroafricanum]